MLQSQFVADVVSVKIDGAGCQAHQLGNFLGDFALPDEVGYLGFRWGKPDEFDSQFTGQG